jgi:hypothetical protein
METCSSTRFLAMGLHVTIWCIIDGLAFGHEFHQKEGFLVPIKLQLALSRLTNICLNFMGFHSEWEWCHYREWHLLSRMMCEIHVSSPATIWPKKVSPSWWWHTRTSKQQQYACSCALQWTSMAPILHKLFCSGNAP